MMESFEKVELYDSASERERYEKIAELYSIIMSIETIERDFSKDLIDIDQYHKNFQKLLLQYEKTVKIIPHELFVNLNSFIREYQMDCPLATERILAGKPSDSKKEGQLIFYVFKFTSELITLMDRLHISHPNVHMVAQALTELQCVHDQIVLLDKHFTKNMALQRCCEIIQNYCAISDPPKAWEEIISEKLEDSMSEFRCLVEKLQ